VVAGKAQDDAIRLLIVDDNHDVTQALSRALGGGNYQVETANDGLAAIERAVQFRPQVVLLDLMLPVLSGWDVARTLRRVPLFAGPRLIALSAFGSEQHRAASLAAGFEQHLLKPIGITKLKEILDHDPRSPSP